MSDEFWQALLQKGPILTLRWKAGRSVQEVSAGNEHFADLQLSPGCSYTEKIHPEDKTRLLELSNQHWQDLLDTSYRLLDSDGREYPVREISFPCDDGSGERRGVLILQDSQTDVERLNDRLSRCEKELQDFAYIASHDLQEPLRKVQAFGGRLNQKFASELGEKGQDYLARMLNATERLQGFLNGLLEYSRVSTRGKPFNSCDLHLVCTELVDRLRRKSEQLDARIAIGELPAIEADCGQIRQLLQHILENALKFHIEGIRPIIAVSAKVNGNKVEIQVKDNGMGFAGEDAEKAFQIFQCLHGRTKFPGAGIGLAVCRRIIERHGGQIDAESAPGRGTTLIMSLPVTQKSQELAE